VKLRTRGPTRSKIFIYIGFSEVRWVIVVVIVAARIVHLVLSNEPPTVIFIPPRSIRQYIIRFTNLLEGGCLIVDISKSFIGVILLGQLPERFFYVLYGSIWLDT
jgi:hypothetical protein